MNVTCLKLVSGIDLIGRIVTESDSGELVLSKVMQIQAFPSAQGISVSLIPFILFGKHSVEYDKITFNPSTYLVPYAPKDELASEYLQQTSGISLVRSGAPSPLKS